METSIYSKYFWAWCHELIVEYSLLGLCNKEQISWVYQLQQCPKAASHHPTTTTMFNCWYKTFFSLLDMLVCLVCFISSGLLSRTMTLTKGSEACRTLGVVQGSFVSSWISCQCEPGVILVAQQIKQFTTV